MDRIQFFTLAATIEEVTHSFSRVFTLQIWCSVPDFAKGEFSRVTRAYTHLTSEGAFRGAIAFLSLFSAEVKEGRAGYRIIPD